MLILLIGAKGSGKSHVGRLLESALGIHFCHVEPLWMAYHAACKERGEQPSIAEGIATVHPVIVSALHEYAHVSVETTGASEEILADLLRLGQAVGVFLVRLQVPLERCLQRIAERDQRQQIPMEVEAIKEVYRLSTALALPVDLIIENSELDDEQILQQFTAAFDQDSLLVGELAS